MYQSREIRDANRPVFREGPIEVSFTSFISLRDKRIRVMQAYISFRCSDDENVEVKRCGDHEDVEVIRLGL